MKNRVKEIIKEKYGSVYRFAKEKDISPQRVDYWCRVKKPSYGLDLTIKSLLEVDKYFW